MSWLDKNRLFFSTCLSFAVWSWLFSWKFALLLITAVLFHEYGHYYWMGREGITKRSMVMLPPFGAMAVTYEPWPSREAETRIALAGPVFGFVSSLAVFVLWQGLHYPILEASVFVICAINMFNLLTPIPIMDGGRVVKSILFSLGQGWGFGFYVFGFIFIAVAVFWQPLSVFFSLFIGVNLFQDFKRYRSYPKMLAQAKTLLGRLTDLEKRSYDEETRQMLIKAEFTNAGFKNKVKNKSDLEEGIRELELTINPLNLKPKAMFDYGLFYVGLNGAYLILFSNISINYQNLLSYF